MGNFKTIYTTTAAVATFLEGGWDKMPTTGIVVYYARVTRHNAQRAACAEKDLEESIWIKRPFWLKLRVHFAPSHHSPKCKTKYWW